ncbi:MAG: NADH-quinone oxidoreductase subunit N [Deltaproteobacteria bacterium]|nr:NADH-quinone oxidoreductase subunit N [Deltaproteobacteria bacterium]MBI3076640.1 NADH-quinone oxidoreductase subunit N [Deltaproteobacteria bacterium]
MPVITDNIASLGYATPELVLAGFFLFILLADLVFTRNRGQMACTLAILGLAMTLLVTLRLYPAGERLLFAKMMAIDPFALFFKIFFVGSTAVIVLLSPATAYIPRTRQGEYYAFLLAITLGMSLLASAADLVMIVLALEMVSVTSYLLAGFMKEQAASAEAALKYAIYGAVATGTMVYGMSLLYGITGTTNLYEMPQAIARGGAAPLALFVAVLLVLVGFGYKIAAVPFHMWAPDVYEGAPTPVTALLSVGPKAAGFAVLIRFFYAALAVPAGPGRWNPVADIDWPLLVAVISAVTMTVGNLIAINQSNLKRLLAYSAIAHAGYILMGFVLLNGQGLYAMLFYLIVYAFMNLGAFLVVIALAGPLRSEELKDYAGLASRTAFPAVAMAVFLFSLTGIPPLAGFVGKFYLFAALIEAGRAWLWLAVVGVLNSVISLYYYARIVKAMFLEKGPSGRLTVASAHQVLIAALLIPTVLLGIYWAPVARFTDYSLRLLGPLAR